MFKKISDVSDILHAIKELLLRICKRIDDHEKSRINIRNNDLIFVSFRSDGVYLNDIKFIDKKASQKIEILKLLFLSQTKALINNSENIGLSWYEISLAMEQVTNKNYE